VESEHLVGGWRGLKGASTTQFVVILLLIGVFVTVAAQRIWQLRAAAERVGVEQMIGSIRSALGIRMALEAVNGGVEGLAQLAGGNPMALLDGEKLPWNYMGELDTLSPEEIPEHHWYFDRQRRILVYRLMFSDGFTTSLEGSPRIRFRLTLDYKDVDSDGVFDPERDYLKSIKFEALEPYRWQSVE